jgi:hypothetical protein
VRIIRRVEEAFEHLAGGGRIEDIAPMKEVKGALSTLSDGAYSLPQITIRIDQYPFQQPVYRVIVVPRFASGWCTLDLERGERPLMPRFSVQTVHLLEHWLDR